MNAILNNWGVAASAAQWANVHNGQHKAETTGAMANKTNNDPLFKQRNAETAGAVAMFDGAQGCGGHIDYAA